MQKNFFVFFWQEKAKLHCFPGVERKHYCPSVTQKLQGNAPPVAGWPSFFTCHLFPLSQRETQFGSLIQAYQQDRKVVRKTVSKRDQNKICCGFFFSITKKVTLGECLALQLALPITVSITYICLPNSSFLDQQQGAIYIEAVDVHEISKEL